MDFSIIYQLRTKKFWWMDVIFYFVLSLLIAAIFCYLVFVIKIAMQNKEIKDEVSALETVGTDQQKEYEGEVLLYQKKIADFVELFRNHEFASRVFGFIEQQTRPNVWFKRFNMDRKGGAVKLSGEADDMEAFSRQVAAFEKNEYVKKLNVLNSTVGESARVEFNLDVILDPKIFSYTLGMFNQTPLLETVTSASESIIQPGQTGKLITLFNFPLTPEVVGAIDQTNYTVTLSVPFGADITNLTPLVNVSTGSIVSPDSGAVQDFTNPVVYKVTAEDGTIQNYTATVEILPKVSLKSAQSRNIVILIFVSIVIISAVILAVFLFIRKKLKNKKQIEQ